MVNPVFIGFMLGWTGSFMADVLVKEGLVINEPNANGGVLGMYKHNILYSLWCLFEMEFNFLYLHI